MEREWMLGHLRFENAMIELKCVHHDADRLRQPIIDAAHESQYTAAYLASELADHVRHGGDLDEINSARDVLVAVQGHQELKVYYSLQEPTRFAPNTWRNRMYARLADMLERHPTG